jgi:4-amino-4-deoxychorismate lyase
MMKLAEPTGSRRSPKPRFVRSEQGPETEKRKRARAQKSCSSPRLPSQPTVNIHTYTHTHTTQENVDAATMKFFENVFTYDYSFPAVSLAYFLRYPNPYSRHVLTSDVIDRYVDPETKRLHTTRLHLKKSKIPSGLLKLLPKGIGGSDNSGQSYILETTVVDVHEGWMSTESRNMEWTGILSVVERQLYERQLAAETNSGRANDDRKDEQTTVRTTVTFRSRLGQGRLLRRKAEEASSGSGDHTTELEEEAPKRGFFSSLSTAGIQRTIELIGVTRTRDAVLRSKQGMNVVLERLRNGGIVAVLEGMRKDRESGAFGAEGTWKRAWFQGNNMKEHAYLDDDDG